MLACTHHSLDLKIDWSVNRILDRERSQFRYSSQRQEIVDQKRFSGKCSTLPNKQVSKKTFPRRAFVTSASVTAESNSSCKRSSCWRFAESKLHSANNWGIVVVYTKKKKKKIHQQSFFHSASIIILLLLFFITLGFRFGNMWIGSGCPAGVAMPPAYSATLSDRRINTIWWSEVSSTVYTEEIVSE